MQVYIVEYASEECIGNQCLTMEILAPNLETAYELVDAHYPDLSVDQIYSKDAFVGYDWEMDAGVNFAT